MRAPCRRTATRRPNPHLRRLSRNPKLRRNRKVRRPPRPSLKPRRNHRQLKYPPRRLPRLPRKTGASRPARWPAAWRSRPDWTSPPSPAAAPTAASSSGISNRPWQPARPLRKRPCRKPQLRRQRRPLQRRPGRRLPLRARKTAKFRTAPCARSSPAGSPRPTATCRRSTCRSIWRSTGCSPPARRSTKRWTAGPGSRSTIWSSRRRRWPCARRRGSTRNGPRRRRCSSVRSIFRLRSPMRAA